MAGELGDGQLKGMKVVAHVNRHKSEIRRPLDEGCPEKIQLLLIELEQSVRPQCNLAAKESDWNAHA